MPAPARTALLVGLLVGLLGWLPLLIAAFLCLRVLDGWSELVRERRTEQLYREVNRISRWLDPEVSMQRRFLPWARTALQMSDRTAFDRFEKKLSDLLGVEVAVVPFERDGTVDQKRKESIANRYVVEKLVRLLTQPAEEAVTLMRQNRKRLNQVFGPDSAYLSWREQEGKAIPYLQRGTRGMLFWKRFPEQGGRGVLIIVWKMPDQAAIFARTMRQRLGRHRSLYALRDRGDPIWLAGVRRASVNQSLYKSAASESAAWFEGDVGWISAQAGNTKLLLVREFSPARPELWRNRVHAALPLLLILVGWLGGMLFRPESTVYLSIRWKLVFLFGLALYLPMVGVIFLGARTLNDRQEVLEIEISRRAREIISRLDGRFAGDSMEFTRLCRRLRDHPLMYEDPRRMQSIVKPLIDQQKIIHWEVRSLQGDLMCMLGAPGFMEGLESFFESMGKAGILRRLADRFTQTGTKMVRPPDPIIEKALLSSTLGFINIVETPDYAHASHVGNVLLYWYWDAYQDAKAPAAMVSIFQSLPFAFRQFLQKQLPDPVTASEGYELIARDTISGAVFPAGIRADGEVAELLDRIQVSRDLVRANVTWNGARWLVTGAPGKYLQDYALLALYPAERVDQRVAGVRWAITGMLILILIFAAVTGLILSRTFLDPIGEIDRGLQALQRRETGYRAEWRRADELGRLVQSFNVMIEDLKEMELARVVQETLTPQAFPATRGYEGKVAMTTASHLGGDYAEVARLADGQILIAIGDVTGHGLGAALLMTMVKAGVFQFIEKPTTLADLRVELNAMVFQHFQRRMMMTFFAALLEPQSGTLHYVCSGHPYPFVVKDGRLLRQLENPQMPLGASSRRAAVKVCSDQLLPGETLVLYTDGCYEATDVSGKMLGWGRFSEIMAEVLHFGVEQGIDGFWSAFRRHRTAGELEDDCTLILVRREESER